MGRSVAQIIARAIYDAGATVVTNVPGFGCTQVFDAFREISPCNHPNSFHEEVAYSIAHSASLVGRRSATLIKAHGFAKAANSVVDSLIVGTMAGTVSSTSPRPYGGLESHTEHCKCRTYTGKCWTLSPGPKRCNCPLYY